MRRRIAAALAAVALVACGGSEAAEDAAAVGAAIDFSAPLVDGTTLDVRQYAGEAVLFWFWAPY